MEKDIEDRDKNKDKEQYEMLKDLNNRLGKLNKEQKEDMGDER